MNLNYFKYSLIYTISLLLLALTAPNQVFADVTWAETGSMNTPRTIHSSTTLTDGRVLVVGGLASGLGITSAELYDPLTETWTATGSLNQGRFEHTATLLNDGRVLVVGGRSATGTSGANQLSSAEIYDPSTGLWTLVSPMNTVRALHTATLLNNGKVLIVGKTGVTLGDPVGGKGEIYDPDTDIWSFTNQMLTPRYNHTATLLDDGAVLITGGTSQRGPEGFTEIYKPSTDSWQLKNALNAPRSSHESVKLNDGRVLVVGGTQLGTLSSAEIYSPNTGSWSLTSSMNTPRFAHRMLLLDDGNVLVTGGHSGSTALTSTEIYNYSTGLWENAGVMNAARIQPSLAKLQNGRILVAGGHNSPTLSSAELFPSTPPDTTPPIITPQISGILGNNGWYTSDVTVSWLVEDSESEITETVGCEDSTLTVDTVGATFVCTATNSVGLTSNESVFVRIDKTAPQVEINSPGDGQIVSLNESLQADWTASDALSGLESVSATAPNSAVLDTSVVGTYSFEVIATDEAGNATNLTHTYYVNYEFGGFAAPLDNGNKVFKTGGVIPVRFQLFNSTGSPISTAVAYIYVAKITDDIIGTDEEPTSPGNADTGNLFRYDEATNTYVYNLSTKNPPLGEPGTYQIKIVLDDGTNYVTNISLK